MRNEDKNSYQKELSPIRLGEFDAGGVLYHARYYHLLEELRESFLRDNNYPYSQFVNEGYHLPLICAEQKFIAPIYYGKRVIGSLKVSDLSKIRLTFKYELFSDDKLVHTSSTTHVLVKLVNEKLKTVKLPEKFFEILNNYNSNK